MVLDLRVGSCRTADGLAADGTLSVRRTGRQLVLRVEAETSPLGLNLFGTHLGHVVRHLDVGDTLDVALGEDEL